MFGFSVGGKGCFLEAKSKLHNNNGDIFALSFSHTADSTFPL